MPCRAVGAGGGGVKVSPYQLTLSQSEGRLCPPHYYQGRGVPFLTRQDNRYECHFFLTVLVKFLFIQHFILAFLGKKVLLTAKIKNIMLVALESAESLYH